MSNADQLQRFTFDNTHVRGEIVGLSQTLRDLFARQNYPEPVQNLLAELLAAASLLSATIKIEAMLTLQLQTTGPIRLLMAEVNEKGELRGIARMDEDQPIAEQDLLGNGQLVITIQPVQGKAYQGIVPLTGNSVGSAIETYFNQSEQLGTRVWLKAEKQQAAGFMLQEMPATEKPDADAWERMCHLADTAKTEELLYLSNTELLHRLYHQEQVRLYDATGLSFRCSCSRARMGDAVHKLGYQECQEVINEQGKIRVDCHFCGQHYSFDQSDVDGLFPLESAKANVNKLH
jgi:molecular chaperone Hsp33